jgi:hypothetical protein
MNILKFAAISLCVALAVTAARADDPDATAHDAAAQCAANNGTFDPSSNECKEPSADSAASDLVVGPMMKGLAPEAQGSEHPASGGQ